jgi:hypothetical protein
VCDVRVDVARGVEVVREVEVFRVEGREVVVVDGEREVVVVAGGREVVVVAVGRGVVDVRVVFVRVDIRVVCAGRGAVVREDDREEVVVRVVVVREEVRELGREVVVDRSKETLRLRLLRLERLVDVVFVLLNRGRDRSGW